MPPPKDYYTSAKALKLMKSAYPDDDPEESLLSVLQTGQVKAWILDEETKRRVPIAPELWWDLQPFSLQSFSFMCDLRSSNAFYISKNIRGEVQVDKEGLDQLLTLATGTEVEKREPPPQRPRGRPTKFDWDAFHRKIVLIANTPDGLPEKQADLEKMMLQWCENTWGKQPGQSTVREKLSPIYRELKKSQ